jgi:GNAT superfamily N-acetyltransferase
MRSNGWRGRVTSLRRTPLLLLIQKMLRQVPLKPVDVGKLCFLRLDGVPQVPRSWLRGPGIARRGTLADLAGLVHLRNQEATFLERFAAGDRCVVAEVDGRIVGYEWFCDQADHRDEAWGYRIAIPSGLIYAYDAYIDPAFRNAGVWLRFKAYLGDLMIESGKRGVLTFVDYGNWPSLKTHARFGFKPDTTRLAVKILGWTISRNVDATGRPLQRDLSPQRTRRHDEQQLADLQIALAAQPLRHFLRVPRTTCRMHGSHAPDRRPATSSAVVHCWIV